MTRLKGILVYQENMGYANCMERRRPPVSTPLVEAAAADYPGAEIVVSFPDAWQLVHRFRQADTRHYVAGMPPSPERPRGDHFLGLPREVNLSLNTYRLYKLFTPRSVPLFHVAWDSRVGQGRIIGASRQRVHLQPLGQAQAWQGETEAVLWEGFLFEPARQREDWPETLAHFWQVVERDLGANRIFTQPHEPTFEAGYTEFLRTLGYTPDPNQERWWRKECDNQTVDEE